MKDNYTQTSDMQKQIDWESILKMERCAGGHDKQMKGLFIGAVMIGHWNEGGYEGSVATCVKLKDGTFAIYNDYYGSCCGCDQWEDASDDDVRKMCISLANGSYIFNSIDDVKEFLCASIQESEDKWSSWSGPSVGLLDSINKFVA